jgi:glycosidase
MRYALRSLLAAVGLSACGGGSTPGPATLVSQGTTLATGNARADTLSHAPWSRNAVIYEVNVRQYTPEGTLGAFQRHLPRLEQLGVDILWMMPVQPIGRLHRKGALGSYYSIADYTAVDPAYGTAADFRALVDAAHRRGMKVILDWVANHTAFDHPWATAHREWYALTPEGAIMNARDNENRPTDWTDVAELNYDNPQMRAAMIADMRFWIDSMGVDGFRCDVAGGVPDDFWVAARAALQTSRADVFLLAEAETPAAHAAFDMTYGWELHHLLNDVAQGRKPTSELDGYFVRQDSAYARDAYRMYFTSNHDENSWQGSELERMGANHVPAFVLAATVQNGMPLLYTGQEVSLRKRLRFFEKDTVDWSGPSLAPFYRALFELKESQPALGNGAWGGRQVPLRTVGGGGRVYAFTRTQGPNTVLVAVNFGDAPASVAYSGLPRPGAYADWFAGRRPVSLPASGRLEIPAHGYRVLTR